MIPSPARAHYLANIVNQIVLIDNNVSTFFSGGVFKGLWNPNALPNELPALSSTNDIYLVSHNSIYHGEVLIQGQLVKINLPPALLVYEKILPVEFFISVVESLLANTPTIPSEGGAGFDYGGEFNAVPTSTYVDATFDVLQFCTDTANVLTPSNSSFYGALATHLSDVDVGTAQNFRFTYPDTANNAFFAVGLAVNHANEPVNAMQTDASSFIGFGATMGTPVAITKITTSTSADPLNITIAVGDIIVMSYRPAINTVYFYNETQGGSLLAQIALSTYPVFASAPLSLLVYATVALGVAYTFIDPSNYPLQRELLAFNLPTDFAKTYHVSSANHKSVINNTLLKEGDFVNFFDSSGITNVAVSRLISNEDIRIIAENEAIAAINTQLMSGGTGSIYNAIQNAVNA